MQDLRLGVVGGGVVGQATARSYLEHVKEVRVYDVVETRRTHSLADTLNTDLIMVCLPTPAREDWRGGLDCSALVNFFSSPEVRESDRHLVLRSTVPIGFTRQMTRLYGLKDLVHSPEFLTARCAQVDAQIPARNIIGVPGGVPSSCHKALAHLYNWRWSHVPVYLLTSDESEAVKLFQNSFFAAKVALWNEYHTVATKLGMDWEAVRCALVADGRISPSHTLVPGPDGKFGFGGACLPKDLQCLIDCATRADVDTPMSISAHNRNLKDRERTV